MTEKQMKTIAKAAKERVRFTYPEAGEVLVTFSDNDCYLDVEFPGKPWRKFVYSRGED